MSNIYSAILFFQYDMLIALSWAYDVTPQSLYVHGLHGVY